MLKLRAWNSVTKRWRWIVAPSEDGSLPDPIVDPVTIAPPGDGTEEAPLVPIWIKMVGENVAGLLIDVSGSIESNWAALGLVNGDDPNNDPIPWYVSQEGYMHAASLIISDETAELGSVSRVDENTGQADLLSGAIRAVKNFVDQSGYLDIFGGSAMNVVKDTDGVISMGFFELTTPVPRPTGVAVTPEAIHAALVSLGLIAP